MQRSNHVLPIGFTWRLNGHIDIYDGYSLGNGAVTTPEDHRIMIAAAWSYAYDHMWFTNPEPPFVHVDEDRGDFEVHSSSGFYIPHWGYRMCLFDDRGNDIISYYSDINPQLFFEAVASYLMNQYGMNN